MSNLIIYTIQMYQLLLVLYAVISWFPQASNTPLSKWLERLCEPYVSLFRQFIPDIGNVSFDVLVGILLLDLVKRVLTGL
ncbi:YggT family protein [Aerococcaceae bacterium NML190938]|nr:YggT family protein [Aerococcaceae bacterium NML190938]